MQRTGLDYAAAALLAPAYGVTLDAAAWSRLRAAETAALEIWNR